MPMPTMPTPSANRANHSTRTARTARSDYATSDRDTLTATLIASCTLYRDLQEEATAIDKQKKALMQEIAPIAKRLNIQKDGQIIAPGIRIRLSSTTNLKKERLLEKGVSVDIIDYATVETTFYKVEKAAKAKNK